MDEFDIIRQYFVHPIQDDEQVVVGPGDDCAVLQVPAGYEMCVSTDTLLSGVHFLENAAPQTIVDRAFGANLSDLAAMGAKPFSATMALTLPEIDETWLAAFSKATRRQVDISNMPVVGGNLARGSLSITLCVMGLVPTGESLLRSGAVLDDDIYVSGFLGDASAGLQQLKAGAPSKSYLVERFVRPTARIQLGESLRGIATAAIDISDGLIADLSHLCRASQSGARIDPDLLPLSAALSEAYDVEAALAFAMSGGDDYELCFTANSQSRPVLQALATKIGLKLTRIGQVTEQSTGIVDPEGNDLNQKSGYNHFL